MAGVGLRVEVARDDFSPLLRRLREFSDGGAQLLRVLEEIGSTLVESTLERFRRGLGPDGAAWKPSERVAKHGGQTLVETGRLRDSITHAADPRGVTVGTNVIYARIHQLGGAVRGKADAMPARPFLGVSAEDQSDIGDLLRRAVERLTRAAP